MTIHIIFDMKKSREVVDFLPCHVSRASLVGRLLLIAGMGSTTTFSLTSIDGFELGHGWGILGGNHRRRDPQMINEREQWLKMAIEIVSFPIQYADIVHRYVSFPEGRSEISDFSYSEPLITDRAHLFFPRRVDQIQPCGAKHGRTWIPWLFSWFVVPNGPNLKPPSSPVYRTFSLYLHLEEFSI